MDSPSQTFDMTQAEFPSAQNMSSFPGKLAAFYKSNQAQKWMKNKNIKSNIGPEFHSVNKNFSLLDLA